MRPIQEYYLVNLDGWMQNQGMDATTTLLNTLAADHWQLTTTKIGSCTLFQRDKHMGATCPIE